MKRKVDFDWYCKTKKDVINNAAYELIVALTAKSAPPRKFELSIPQWDDLMIANIVENAINAIDERIGYYCHPFYHEVDKLPCYLGDRCDNPHCIFKSDPDYRKAPSSVMDREPERFQLAAVVEIVDHRPRIEYLRTSETVAVVPVTYFIIFFRNAIVFSHLSNFIWSKAEVRAVLAVEDRIDRDII